MKPNPSFVCIGSGNVGEFLCSALTAKGYKLLQVAGRNDITTRNLAAIFNCNHTTNLSELNRNAGFYLITVSDRSIPAVISQLKPLHAPVFHTSGSTPIEVLSNEFADAGVLYPLQSISSSRKINPQSVPFLLEPASPVARELLIRIASDISGNYRETTSVQRMQAHIAAVFASNFTNHCLAMAFDLMKIYGLDHALLQPLINETMVRCAEIHPAKVQTGPAVRSDNRILEKHELALSSLPQYQKLYTFVSNSIQDYHTKEVKE
jgi:predicted short-subunit dehydrogenase-like oxidoreductase (DUF2520 family)